jgi:hypothetical protein
MTVSDPCQVDFFRFLYHYRSRCPRQVKVKLLLLLCGQLFKLFKENRLLIVHESAPLALARLRLFLGLVELPHSTHLFLESRAIQLEILLLVLLYIP